MKKIFIYIIALIPLVSLAQVDRTKAPDPSPAPKIQIGKPTAYTLPNGLRIFVVQNSKLPRVSATLTIDFDGMVEGDKAGLTSLAGSLLRRGTKGMTKEQLDEEVDFLGASINTSASSASAFALKNNFPRVFQLMSDVVLHPALPSTELEKLRKKELSSLQSDKDDPNAIADNVANRLVFGKGHPYGDIETEQTVNNVKLADIQKFFYTYWKPNNAYLVFVGAIAPEEARQLAVKYFGSWAKGTVPKPTYKMPEAPAKTYVAIVDRPASVQSIITFVSPVSMKPGAPDAITASVMNNILGGGSSGRLFLNLREKHAFTYGAYSSFNPDRLVGKFEASASVRNEKTDSAIHEFLSEFKRLRGEAFDEVEVGNMKSYLSGGFARSLENPGTIASFALNIARNNLPADYYQNYLQNLGSVTPQSVSDVANRYVNPDRIHIIVVGNAKQIASGLEKYGEVKYFDVYGKEVPAPVVKKVDASVTPESIIQKGAAAVGTAEAVAAVKDLTMVGEASMMGQTITVTRKIIIPTAYTMEVTMPGMGVLQKQTLKNGKYSVSQRGQEGEADKEDMEEMDENAAFFDDAYMLKQTGNTYKLGGIEKVDGKDAYLVGVKTAGGREFTNYYDIATGLKVKQSRVAEGPTGKATIQTYLSNYKNYNGIQIPTHVVVDMGQFKQDITMKDIKINSGLKVDDF